MIKIIEIRLDYKQSFFSGNICGNNVLSFKPTEGDSPSVSKCNFGFFSSTGNGFLSLSLFKLNHPSSIYLSLLQPQSEMVSCCQEYSFLLCSRKKLTTPLKEFIHDLGFNGIFL